MGRDVQNSECKMENSKCTFLQFTFKMSLKSHLAFPMYFRKKKSEKNPLFFYILILKPQTAKFHHVWNIGLLTMKLL